MIDIKEAHLVEIIAIQSSFKGKLWKINVFIACFNLNFFMATDAEDL